MILHRLPDLCRLADGGKIVLTGTVQSPHDRQIAAQTAWSAPGATNVENDIAVA